MRLNYSAGLSAPSSLETTHHRPDLYQKANKTEETKF